MIGNSRITTLVKGDVLQLTRDPVYAAITAGPLLLACVVRFGVPVFGSLLSGVSSIYLMDYYTFIVALFSQIPSMLVGFFAGFILLDDRDEGLLEYFSVTPLTSGGYLAYRLILPCTLSIPVVLIYFLICGAAPGELLKLIPSVAGVSLQGALLVMYLGAFASNKVEGLALGKTFGVILIAPVVGYFAPGSWHWLGAVLPTFWTAESALAGLSGESLRAVLFGIAGIIHYSIFIVLLYRRFIRRIL